MPESRKYIGKKGAIINEVRKMPESRKQVRKMPESRK